MVGDIYKLVTTFSYLGQVCQNRYYYKQISLEEDNEAEDVQNAWLLGVYPAMKAVQADDAVLFQIYTINLMNPVDFIESPITGATGDLTGPPMPPFVTWTYKLNRNDRTFRPGRKAVVGVTEDRVTEGVADASIIDDLNDLAVAFGDILVTPIAGASMRPNLVREVVGLPPSASCQVTSAQYVAVSTQNSRKFGRGS